MMKAFLLFYILSVSNAQECASVQNSDPQNRYDPSIEGFDENKMQYSKYIQYHSIEDFHKFNQMAGISGNENELAYRIYLTKAAK